MSDTEFLDNNQEDTQVDNSEVQNNEQNSNFDENEQNNENNENQFQAPSWEDVKSGKIEYKDLPPNIKSKIKSEAYEETPDDKKYLWDDYGYTPPETYNGVDRNGKPVEGFGLDGFEELVKKGRIKPKTKIEQDVENLTNLVKEQNKSILSQRESEIDKKMAQAREDMDFEAYEKARQEKQDLELSKIQLDKKPQESSEIDISQQYSLDEQVAIRSFAEGNPQFVNLMQRNKQMESYFDQVAMELYQKNPNADPNQILEATKRATENRFNINRQSKPMFRNNVIPSQKTNIEPKATPKLNYNSLNERDKKWINSEAKSGRAKYAGKSLDDITNMVFGHLLKK